MGDIRKSIRKAFRKKTLKEAVVKWSSDTQPNIYELDNFLRKSGYRLVDIIEHEDSSKGYIPELIIEPINPGYLHPEIQHDIKEGWFYAKVVEHGFLVSSDLEEIIKGYTTALGIIDYLDTVNLDKLEIHPEDREGE